MLGGSPSHPSRSDTPRGFSWVVPSGIPGPSTLRRSRALKVPYISLGRIDRGWADKGDNGMSPVRLPVERHPPL